MSTLLVAALVMAAVDSAHPAAAFVDAWHKALRSASEDAVLAGLAPEVTIFESGEAEMSRDEYAAHHLRADMEYAAATTTTVRARSVVEIGSGVLVLSQTTTSGTFRGKQVNGRGVETMVVERSGETWRIRHIHWSSGRAPAPPTP